METTPAAVPIRHESPMIEPARARELLHQMLRIRQFEERCVQLYSAGDIRGFLHLYVGEEAVAVGVLAALEADDAVVATYREHGHALVRGVTMRAVMAEMFGKVEGCSRGRGGSMHLFASDARFYGGHAIVGGGLPVAVGLALAEQMQRTERIVVCFFGEGAMAEGEFHESINLAALWRLPIVFVCENNLYAMGTALDRSESETNLSLKAASYEVPAWSVDGMDVLAVLHAATAAVNAVRTGGGPLFLEAKTFRFRAHSMYDPDRYRTKDEIAAWKQRDPIDALLARLEAAGDLDPSELPPMKAAIEDEIDDAVAAARAGTDEPVELLTRWVCSDPVDAESLSVREVSP